MENDDADPHCGGDTLRCIITAAYTEQWANARKTKNENRKSQIAQPLTIGWYLNYIDIA